MHLHTFFERHWQNPKPFWRGLLRPFSRLFARIATRRRARFVSGSLNTQKLPVPVIVVGNIHVGGTGKTPITAALVQSLQNKGIKVGIISRGYGRCLKTPHVLHSGSTAAQAGDEPLMLFRQTDAPTAVARSRYEAGMALLAAQPDLQMIVSDDGLQHYALARDVEICVFPAADVGRHDLDVLPNGSLREPLSRLPECDAVVVSNGNAVLCTQLAELSGCLTKNQTQQASSSTLPTFFYSNLQTALPYRYNNPTETLCSGSLKNGVSCAAAAAIARPERFFNSLHEMGFTLHETRVFPDHAQIDVRDLPSADYVFITEKDAVKLPRPAPENVWVLPVYAIISPDLSDFVIKQLKSSLFDKATTPACTSSA
ncbi:MAG: tetraacyldisaccharide 4'-kinase [Alysiella sp.]|uniref:tetraacyldisaccharide 4'-kinase n=1 Tax=Alysiella sp. TaxID=1872483 RepID=UPI0026DAA0FB|nr:tetraacyldisaccharide 4'-kinase [Alysiella sp.]MDO4433153.1 tetraacyldisaccharide 4'-kinase [Alysiella sp.]